MTKAKDIYKDLADKYPAKKKPAERIPTRSAKFNQFLGSNDDGTTGIPLGKVISLWGQEGIGKSHISLEMCYAMCHAGKNAIYLDYERALEPNLWEGIGLDEYLGERFFPHSEGLHTHRDMIELMESFMEDPDTGLVVIDSLAMVSSVRDRDKLMGDTDKGLEDIHSYDKAKLDTEFFRSFKGELEDNQVSCVVVSQQRTEINMRGNSRKKMAGGHCFYHSGDIQMKLWMEKSYSTQGSHITDYADIHVLGEKNRTDEAKETVVTVRYGKGFDPILSLFNVLKENEAKLEWYEQNGPWYKLEVEGDWKKSKGAEQFHELIESNKDYVQQRLEGDNVI